MSRKHSVCSAMFYDLNIRMQTNTIKNCCKSNNTVIPLEEVERLGPKVFTHNQEYIRRKTIMIEKNTLPVHGCDTCITTYPYGMINTRDTWQNKSYDDIVSENLINNDNLIKYEFNMSSACDLACIYCAPKDSSSWAKELGIPMFKGSDQWKDAVTANFIEYLHTTHVNTGVQDKKDYYFFFSGGEPTYNVDTIQFIEQIVTLMAHKKMSVIITTNLNTKDIIFQRYMDLVDRYPNIKWVYDCSLDAVGDRCEAIRTGLNWDTALNNLKKLFKKNITVRFGNTLTLYSLPYLKETLEFYFSLAKEYGKTITFNENFAGEPGMSIRNLPVRFRDCLEDPIKICQDNNNTKYANFLIDVKNLIGTKIDESIYKNLVYKFTYFETTRPNIKWRELFPHIPEVITEYSEQYQTVSLESGVKYDTNCGLQKIEFLEK